jgi:hypothetical protein
MDKPNSVKGPHRPGGVGIICWLALLWLSGGLAAKADLQFDVFVGYGLGANEGVAAEGNWFPVFCEVFNDGPTFSGFVTLGNNQSGEKYRVGVELPTGTRKRILIPYFANSRWVNLEAQLRDARGKLRAERSQLQLRLCSDATSPLIGSLSRTLAGGVSLPKEVRANDQQRPAVARMTLDLFPDHVIALDGLSSLYLHSSRAAELKVPQVTALLAWLHAGGHLILGVEQPSDVNATAWLSKMMPCEITSITNRTGHAELQAWLNSDSRRPGPGQRPPSVSRGRSGKGTQPDQVSMDENPFVRLMADPAFEGAPLPVAVANLRDGKVILGRPDAPLALQCARGRGTLTVLLFSPELEPFKSWQHRSWFWAKLGGAPIEWLAGWNPPSHGGIPLDSVFGAMTDSKQIRKLPVVWLFVLLLGYLAIIGPVDQYVLKRLNKQMLTWITFPAYVAFFSVLIYYLGYRLRAGEAEWNEFHVVDVTPHAERAELRGRTYGSIYSPANAQYPVASEAAHATLRGEVQSYGGAELSKAMVAQQGNSYKALLDAPIWTSRLFLSDWWGSGPLPIRLTVSPPTNGLYEVKIENLTGYKIPQAKIILEGRVHNLGELTRTHVEQITRTGGTPVAEFVRNQTGHFAAAAEARRSTWGGHEEAAAITDLFSAAAAASFLAGERSEVSNPQPYPGYGYQSGFAIQRGFDLGANAERGDAILLAWLPDHLLMKPLNQFTPKRAHQYTLLRAVVPMK